MNDQDRAVVAHLVQTWQGTDTEKRRELERINDNSLYELYKSRESLRLQTEANQRAIDMREMFARDTDSWTDVRVTEMTEQ